MTITCAQCHMDAPHAGKGLCRLCYQYQHRTGRPRPATVPTTCVCCHGALGPTRVGRICRPCYMHAHYRGLHAADIYAGRRATRRAVAS